MLKPWHCLQNWFFHKLFQHDGTLCWSNICFNPIIKVRNSGKPIWITTGTPLIQTSIYYFMPWKWKKKFEPKANTLTEQPNWLIQLAHRREQVGHRCLHCKRPRQPWYTYTDDCHQRHYHESPGIHHWKSPLHSTLVSVEGSLHRPIENKTFELEFPVVHYLKCYVTTNLRSIVPSRSFEVVHPHLRISLNIWLVAH